MLAGSSRPVFLTVTLAALAGLGAVLSGCSTVRPVPSHRTGLIADLSHKNPREANPPSGTDEEVRAIRMARRLRGVRQAERQIAADRASSSPGPAASASPAAPVAAGGDGFAPAGAAATKMARLGLHWPLQKVEVTSEFGRRTTEFHEGIDLRAKVGTPVMAAQAGTVVYSGSRIRGYGKMVVIRHEQGLATVYAHNSRVLVHAGDQVAQGQKIALSGMSGRASGPHLHFEVRSGIAAINPLAMMPHTALVDDSVIRSSGPIPVRRHHHHPRRQAAGQASHGDLPSRSAPATSRASSSEATANAPADGPQAGLVIDHQVLARHNKGRARVRKPAPRLASVSEAT